MSLSAHDRARLLRLVGLGIRGRGAVIGVEQEWNDHLGPELAGCLHEALTKLRDIADPYG